MDAAGCAVQRGDSEAVIDDAGLNVGLVGVSLLDVDGLSAANHRIELDLWPGGSLVLEGLGRRHDAFVAELRRARNRTRVAGLLAHAPSDPDMFEGAQLAPGAASPVEIQVYSTHVTIVPAEEDPWQLPLGAMSEIARANDPPTVTLKSGNVAYAFGMLARRREAFYESTSAARNAQAQLLERLTGHRVFSDGLGVPRDRLPGFDALLANFASSERLDGARKIVGMGSGGEPRIGFVQLLDPDGDSLAARRPLPGDWASFLLVPVGPLVILEVLAGPKAATYVFEGIMDAVNRDLQLLHFRRAALALSAADAAITQDNPHRLALRRLAPLKRLRTATRGRLVHNATWSESLAEVITQTCRAVAT